MKHPFGYLFIIFSIVVTICLWYIQKQDAAYVTTNFLQSFIQLSGLLGTVLMALSIALGTRLKLLVNLFGGLDKDYRAHASIGSVSIVLVLAHPLLLTFDAIVKAAPVLRYYIPGNNIAYDFGILSFYTLLFSLLFMIAIKLPYHLWKYTHQVLVFTFIFGGMHGFLADSDIIRSFPLKILMLSFFTLGVTTGLYMVFLYNRFGPNLQYAIESVKTLGDVLEVYLKPLNKKITFSPGEFVFVRFYHPHISKELHPFSISSTPEENLLRLSIKMVGDYTMSMKNLAKGDRADLYGPFGAFGNIYKKITPHMIWIAGGIGVTPFLSLLHEEAINPQPGSIKFFYTYRTRENAYVQEIAKLVSHTPRVTFIPWDTPTHPRLSASEILTLAPNLKENIILLCGPRPMMHSLEKQLLNAGALKSHIVYEDFNFM